MRLGESKGEKLGGKDREKLRSFKKKITIFTSLAVFKTSTKNVLKLQNNITNTLLTSSYNLLHLCASQRKSNANGHKPWPALESPQSGFGGPQTGVTLWLSQAE